MISIMAYVTISEGECDVDQVDGGRDRVGDNPPLVRRQHLGTVLLGVVDQFAPILIVECKQALEVDPTVSLFRAFHVHANDEDVLRTQIDRERVGELDLAITVDVLDQGLDDNVDLMRHTPDPQNLVLSTRDNASHDIGVMACHGVLVVNRHANQLRVPLDVQRVHKLADHIEDVEPRVICRNNMSIEMWSIVSSKHITFLMVTIDLAGDRIGRVHVVIVVIAVTFVELLIISKEQVVNDRFSNASADDELERVYGQVHVRVQRVGLLYLVVKVGLLLSDR
ncbi:unnamed protein product [Sphagnum jensenii]